MLYDHMNEKDRADWMTFDAGLVVLLIVALIDVFLMLQKDYHRFFL